MVEIPCGGLRRFWGGFGGLREMVEIPFGEVAGFAVFGRRRCESRANKRVIYRKVELISELLIERRWGGAETSVKP
jgi:hypothetical protein